MTSLNRPAHLNRLLLAIVGVLLLAAGVFALARHYARLTSLEPHATLIPAPGSPPTWIWWVTAAVAITLGLLMLRWTAAQTARRPKHQTWHLEQNPEQGSTELATDTATVPFLKEVTTYPGVHNAHATIAGTRQHPTLVMRISTEQDSDLTTIGRHLKDNGLPRLRQALDLDTLPVTVEYRFTTHTAPPGPDEGPADHAFPGVRFAIGNSGHTQSQEPVPSAAWK
ncbi:hypothetical protein ACFWU3_36060 [Streptomyces sp. NPDC058685]|uniref:hypothetical protein n=1 Tax=Streptomyces sp. NPDC058685 TaxID=3346598 RepID=UPI00365308EE